MARDEALLQTVAATGQSALRLYFWENPCLSLGYFQKYEDRQLHPPSQPCDCVRRSSGGGAILHDHELTYSYAVPVKAGTRSTEGYYDAFHNSLVEALALCGVVATTFKNSVLASQTEPSKEQPFLCFQRRTEVDIVADGVKITGSAQRKRHKALLQHGSILLKMSEFAPELLGASELSATGEEIDPLKFVWSWIPLLSEQLELTFARSFWTEEELTVASAIKHEKFLQNVWTRKR